VSRRFRQNLSNFIGKTSRREDVHRGNTNCCKKTVKASRQNCAVKKTTEKEAIIFMQKETSWCFSQNP